MNKLKNICNKIIVLILLLGSFLGVINVNASGAPETVKMASKSSMYYLTGSEGYISGYSTYIKKLTDGTLVYCSDSAQKKAPGGQTLEYDGEADAGLVYILSNGYPNKSFTGNYKKDYYITQSAIWEYFDRTRGTNNWRNTSFENASEGSMKYYVDMLASGGEDALKRAGNNQPTISLSVSNKNLTIENGYYVSQLVTVNTKNNDGTYTIDLSKAPSGTVVKNEQGYIKTTFNNGEKFRVYVPTTNSFSKVTLSVSTKKTYYVAYEYEAEDDDTYQDIVVTTLHKKTKTATSSIDFTNNKTMLSISKQDITTKKELPGATLVLKDSTGKVVDTWVSTNEPHYIENLAVGKYTLTETIAPEGYILSSETITFDLTNDGVVKKVIMYNTKKDLTKIYISKQDITTKKELPGATLVIKNAKGEVVHTWVSTNEPHYIEKLPIGKYTLTETIAPEGYVLSSETIEFEVKQDGKIQTVVMYNAKCGVTKILISKQDITTKEEVPGATLVIKNAKGEVVHTWVSTNEPHLFDKLPVGKYTLTETIAPEGYELSSETIEFEVKNDGQIKTVIMYNTRTVSVPPTALNASSLVIGLGIMLLAFGSGVVFKYVKE